MNEARKVGGSTGIGNRGKGRKPGVPNRTTRAVKEALEETFEKLGGVDFLKEWAEQNPTEFLKLWSKLLPSGVHLAVGHAATLEDLVCGPMRPDERLERQDYRPG